ncbi:hypothetical protein GCM10009674_11260 [Nesterenkonia xinjiangensis]
MPSRIDEPRAVSAACWAASPVDAPRPRVFSWLATGHPSKGSVARRPPASAEGTPSSLGHGPDSEHSQLRREVEDKDAEKRVRSLSGQPRKVSGAGSA